MNPVIPIPIMFAFISLVIIAILLLLDHNAKDFIVDPLELFANNENYIDDDVIHGPARISIYPSNISMLSRFGLLPWWNSTRHTRNSSYDLRGDVPILIRPVGPWLNSSL